MTGACTAPSRYGSNPNPRIPSTKTSQFFPYRPARAATPPSSSNWSKAAASPATT